MQPSIDLNNCDQEPIQWPGFIQPYGYLLAIDPETRTIWQASENLSQLTGLPVANSIGTPIDQLQLEELSGTWLNEIITVALRSGNPEAFSPYPVQLGGQPWLILLHQHDGALILELEPAQQPQGSVSLPLPALLTQAMSDIQRSKTLAELLDKTAQQVKQITGFDRVMIYQFGEDWHGEVIAEACQEQLDPFLGLHYPASDIPRQARELYKINLVRGIGDVHTPRVPILPLQYAHYNRPLDLTHANLRAVSPIHVEYLRNMGVRASLSISLLYRGELWGLIACHHYNAPRFVNYEARQSLKLISQLLSTVLDIRKEDEETAFAAQLMTYQQALHQQMQDDWDVVQGLTRHPITVLNLTTATGAALLFEGKLHLLGNTPSAQEVMGLLDWLHGITTESVFQTDQLPNLYPPAEAFRSNAAGLLVLVLSRQMNEYLVWFKPEQILEVFWGGNPEKPVTLSPQGEARLSPRQSFDKWTQRVRNKAQPWQRVEVTQALKLREDMLQVVAQKANQIRTLNEQLRFSNEELEAFSYTVSHELRSPLTAVKRYSEIFLADYGAQLDESAKTTFDKIVIASDRMSMLIRSIMQYSKVGSGGVTRTVLPMREVLTQLREELLAGETSRTLTMDIGETPNLEGDRTMVTQVFSNLLSNAVKYSRLVPQARVSVQGRRTGRDVIYAVSDNGIGIDMKQVGKVFELFQRLDSASSYEGYGVGLAIVKRIMHRHEGKVWFESVPHQSTTFYVSFPTSTL